MGTKRDNRFYRERFVDPTVKEFQKLLKGCQRCDYDEAEGVLIDHCAECRRKVTLFAWKTYMEDINVGRIPR